MFNDLIDALWHAAVYAILAGVLLVIAYYVLDAITPGHLGKHLLGVDENGAESVHHQSRSAGLVTSAWLVSNAAVLFTSIWQNGETAFGWALGYTFAFGLFGIALNTVMFLVVEAVTPGNLRTIVTQPGPIRPLAFVAASVAVSVGAIVCASIA